MKMKSPRLAYIRKNYNGNINMLQKEVSTKSTYAEAQSYNEDMKLTSNPTPTMAARLAVKHTSGHHEFPKQT